MKAPLSICLIARDEELELARCLDSLPSADEVIVVVDSRSVDGTEQLARERASRVEVRPYTGQSDQKSHCLSLARNEWVMIMDPDEVVPAALAAEIEEKLVDPDEGLGGLSVNRRTWHLGRWIMHGDFYPDWTLRVFRRSRSRWVGDDPHARIEVDGRIDRLSEDLEHYSYRDLADQVDRIQQFSAESARALSEAGRRARLRDLLFRPPARFLRAYLLRRGFMDGIPGLVIAWATAFHVFLKYAKLWERQQRG
ncbi:MAG: glycosyltransferase family 2 protein [Myxococcota bacterium]|nr:glycosyl transferase [Spirochaeta sp.]RPG03308.1 MAG: glycosyltransferase family 2 protein [Proteobacteria bacterium TMED72]